MGVPGTNRYRVQVQFGLENTAFVKGLRDVNTQLDNTQKQIRANYGALSDTLTRINRTILITLGGITAAFAAVAIPAIKMSGEFERLAVTFEVLSGNAERAQQLIKEIKEFAVKTPLQLRDIQEAATLMLAFGYSIDDVLPKLELFGQASAALRVPMEQIIRVREFLAGGQFRAVMLAPLGITRREMERFGAEFGPSGELLTGVEESLEIFDRMLNEYAGLFDRVFGTITGRISNIVDQVELTLAGIGDALKPLAMEVMDWLETNFNRLREFLEANRVTVTQAFLELVGTVQPLIVAMADAFERFMTALEKDPELLVRLAQNINKIVKALVGMLIINTVVIGIIKFATAITFLTSALEIFGITWAAVGAFLIGPWGIAIAAVITGISTIVYLVNRSEEAHAAHRRELERDIEKHVELRNEVVGLKGEINAITAETEVSADTFASLRDRVVDLENSFPGLLNQIGYGVDAEGNLIDATGSALTTIGDLQNMMNTFSTESFVAQINRAINAMRMEQQAEARREFFRQHNFMYWLTRGGATSWVEFQEWREQAWAAEAARMQAGWTEAEAAPPAGAGTDSSGPPYPAPAGYHWVNQNGTWVLVRDAGAGGGRARDEAERFGRGDRMSEAEWLAFQDVKRQADLAAAKAEEELLTVRSEQAKITDFLAAAEAEKLRILQGRLLAEKVINAFELKRRERQVAEAEAEKQTALDVRRKRDELERIAREPMKQVFRSLRESIIDSAGILGASIISGDIAVALNKVFSMLGQEIGNYVNKLIAPKGAGLGSKILGSLAGGIVGAGIGWLGSLFTGKGGSGSTPSTPNYVYVVNFPEDRLGAYLPFSFMASGRSERYDVDYRGASLDQMRSGRRLGFHYGK